MKVNTMKRLMVTALAVLLFPGSLALAGQKKTKIDKMKFPPLNEIKRPEIIKGNTANGIQLRVIKSEKLPIIDLRIMIKGGTVYDPPSKVGLAGLTARLIRIGGTTQLKPDQLDKLLDTKGIAIAVGAREDYFTVTLSCLTENFDEAVSILAKLLLDPVFDPEKLEEVKGQLSSAIARRNDQAMGIVGREF
ncbi:MAG: insulinase family protein, partial [bacterium]|nr:insulinase family protein [bacterium]